MNLLGKSVGLLVCAAGLACASVFVTGEAAAQDATGLKGRGEREPALVAAAMEAPGLKAELAKVRVENEELQKLVAAVREEVALLRKSIQQLQGERDQRLKQELEATNRLHQVAAEVKRLKAENARLLGRLRRPPPRYATMPPREGLVTAVAKPGKVEISLGSDDGVLKGHWLQVYRVLSNTTAYVARIEVVQSEPDKSVCRIDPAFRDVVRKGDRVTTAPWTRPQPGELPYLTNGEVLSVGEDGRVEISFGADHGLWPGHRLEVYRLSGDTGVYVGRVEVLQTTPKKSVCKSIIEFQKHPVKQGDRVASKL